MAAADGTPIRVLLVDDDVDHGVIVRRTLERQRDFTVHHVTDGFACLEALARESFAVVLLDYSLPRLNGLEVLERIRARGDDVPVVIATGQGDERIAVQAMRAGAIDYVMKTSGYFATLPTVLNKVLKQHELALDNARLYAETRAQHARLGQIFDSTSDGIVLVDAAGAVVFANRRAGELFGFEARAAGGRSLIELVARASGRAAPLATAELRGLFDAVPEPADGDIELQETGQVLHWIGQPTDDGETHGFTITFQDVTREREMSRLKSDFVSFAAHQLRTPLTGIKWKLEIAAEEPDLSPVLRSCIDDAAASANRLIAMVHDLLHAARLENGTVRTTPKPTDLAAVTRTVVDDLSGAIVARQHAMSMRVDDALPAVIVDEQLVRQAILNLVSNAVKYTPPGGAITITVAERDAWVDWTIEDSGIGIPRSASRRLFEKFYRADNAGTVDTEGTGLGLYMVRLIMARFGGRLHWTSEEGRGTTIGFALPVEG